MKFLKRYFIFIILLFSFTLQADESLVWSLYKDNIRHILNIEQEVKFFKTQHDAFLYIFSSHPKYTQEKKLVPWESPASCRGLQFFSMTGRV